MTEYLLPPFAATPRGDLDALEGKVLCCDALELLAMLPSNSVDVFSDIPYGEAHKVSNGLRVIDKGNADIVTFDLSLLANEVARVTRQWAYVFCGYGQVSTLDATWRKYGTTRLLIWKKKNPHH